MWSSLFGRPYWLHPLAQTNKQKTFGVVPRSRAHIMEASDCVFELFGWRTVTRPVAKNRLLYFVPKTPGYTLFCQLPKIKNKNHATQVFKKNLNASKPSEHPPQVKECLHV